jgi:hypothetical protein
VNTLEDLKTAIRRLSAEDLAAFRAWFAEHDAEVWDRQFEDDVRAGRLDGLADAALRARKRPPEHRLRD